MSAPVPELVRDFIRKGHPDDWIANATGHNLTQIRGWRQQVAGTTGARAAMLPTTRLVPHPKNVRSSLGDLDELADFTGPATTGAVRARNRGWLPPLWWDDDTIDDPTWTPPLTDHPRSRDDVDPVIVDRLVNGAYTGRPTPAERFHAFVRLTRQGVGSTEIERLLHLSWQRIAELRALADTVSFGRAA